MIRAIDVAYGYPGGSREIGEDRLAIGPISIDFPDGSFTSLVGPSGCGKTTFLEILSGQRPPASGSVSVNGVELYPREPESARKKMRRWFRDGNELGMSMIFQDAQAFPWLTARENVEFALSLKGVKKPGDRAAHWLNKVGLGNDSDKYPSQLSGGMAQRLGLARALACEPRILLMDEPFSALDPPTRKELHELLLSLHGDSGCTAILVTHDMHEAIRLSSRIALISGFPGRMRAVVPVPLARPRKRQTPEYRALHEELRLLTKHTNNAGETLRRAPLTEESCQR